MKGNQEWINNIHINGDKNIVLKDVSHSYVTVLVNDTESVITELKRVLKREDEILNILLISQDVHKWTPYSSENKTIFEVLDEYNASFSEKMIVYVLPPNKELCYDEMDNLFEYLKNKFIVVLDVKAIITNEILDSFLSYLESSAHNKFEIAMMIPLCEILDAKYKEETKLKVKSCFQKHWHRKFFERFRENVSNFEPFIPTKEFFFRRLSNFAIEKLKFKFTPKTKDSQNIIDSATLDDM